jgi:hypothetical protein
VFDERVVTAVAAAVSAAARAEGLAREGNIGGSTAR